MGCSVSATSQKQQGGGQRQLGARTPRFWDSPQAPLVPDWAREQAEPDLLKGRGGEAQPGPDTGLKTQQQSHFHGADHVPGPAPAPGACARPSHCRTSRGPGAAPC